MTVSVGSLVVYDDIRVNVNNWIAFVFSSGFPCGVFGRWWNRLVLLAHTDGLFYPMFLFGVYTAIGTKKLSRLLVIAVNPN